MARVIDMHNRLVAPEVVTFLECAGSRFITRSVGRPGWPAPFATLQAASPAQGCKVGESGGMTPTMPGPMSPEGIRHAAEELRKRRPPS